MKLEGFDAYIHLHDYYIIINNLCVWICETFKGNALEIGKQQKGGFFNLNII